MHEEFDLFSFLIDLPLAIIIMIIVFTINRRIGKKKRWFDERYTKINEKARSISWISTTFAILIAWMIIIAMEGPGLSFFILMGIWLVHMISYTIGAIIANQEN
ncbi:hypothetical protein ACFVR1_18725 [Psychrobacillus sp. NPDC058041]|uniref:hypothetical protein n=1 Tax=Psychrobacillus sp. NPDC058041 TaxID=3346310 RepID=UPI0036DB805A